LNLVRNLLLNVSDAFRVTYLSVGNVNTKCLNFRGLGESGIDVSQGAESADHKSRTDQKDNCQCHLNDYEQTACTLPLTTFTHGTSAL
jgi:hypothetical protein